MFPYLIHAGNSLMNNVFAPPARVSKGVLKMEIRKIRLGTAICVAAAGWLTAGCNSDRDQTPPTVVTTTAPAPPPSTTYVGPTTPPMAGQVNPTAVPQTNNTNAGPGGPTGTELGDRITREIHTNAQMTGSRITAVSTVDGTVRLTGRAQNQQQRALAAKTAKNEPGTTSVIDKIQIVPTGGIKTAAAPPKVIVKNTTKYFYIHDGAQQGGTTSQSTGDVDNSMNSGNSKRPMSSTGMPGADTSVDDSNM